MKRCLLLLVALATIPSAFALPPGEFPIAPLAMGLAPYGRQNVEVAANDALAFAVWEDSRVDPNQPRLWGARIARDSGVLLDPTGISIARLPVTPGSRLLDVATDGTDFLVAWTEGNRLKLAKVTAGGAIIALPTPNFDVGQVSMNWVGDGYAIFATAPSTPGFSSPDIAVILVTADVTVPAGIVVNSRGAVAIASRATANGSVLFIAWSDIADGEVHAASFSAEQIRNGPLIPAPAIAPVTPAATAPAQLSMATNGVEIFTAWLDTPANPEFYRVRRFNATGTPLGPPEVVAEAPAVPAGPAVTWDGSHYVVTFKAKDNSVKAVRYDAGGTRIDSTPLSVSADDVADIAAAAPSSGDPDSFVAWIALQTNGSQVSANFLSQGGTLRYGAGNLSLSTSFVDRSDATVVWRGNHYLAAWRDTSNFTRAVIGRLSSEGQPLDGTGITVSSGAAASQPALASNGRTAVVVWLDSGGVAASFVDEAAHVSRLLFDFPGGLPAVNWNGQQYLVAWRSSQGQLVGLRVTAAGALIDQQPVTIAPVTGPPFIGWTGNSYVVAYQQIEPCFPICPDPPTALWAQLVTPALTAIGSRIQLSEHRAGVPAIADGPSGALVVWPRTVIGPVEVGPFTTLRGVRVVNGAILDPLNGFEIGAATYASVYASAAGWGVVSGPYLWLVSTNGGVTPRSTAFPFVPAGAHSSVVLGGPEPLVVYRREPVGTEQMMQVVARYVIPAGRRRGVRH